jgi:protein-disulfide isomerase
LLEQFSGQIQIVFKQFPLNSHAFATKAALASLAAHEQGKFWEFHDLLFQFHDRLNDEVIEEIRSRLDLDAARFRSAMAAPASVARVNADIRDGIQAGVRGTPTVFVNGILLRDKSPRGFQQAVREALQKATSGKAR